MTTIARRILVSGTVTGVGFRYSARREAQACPGLQGYVRNASQRQVECVLQGESRDVEAMTAWLRHGPPGARVVDMSVIEIPVDENRGLFRVTY